MKLAELCWTNVRDLERETPVVVPTGSLEQHGPHLPLFTDSLLVTAVAEAVETRLAGECLLTPTLWLGASEHHLAYEGTLSAGFESYIGSLVAVVESLARHGFRRFFVLNGHGGNIAPNGVASRTLKAAWPNLLVAAAGYYEFIPDELMERTLEGPVRSIYHACEAETSLMLHLHPGLVRMGAAVDDGLRAVPEVRGLVTHFSEISELGPLGYPTLATADKGRVLFEAAVAGVETAVRSLGGTVAFEGPL